MSTRILQDIAGHLLQGGDLCMASNGQLWRVSERQYSSRFTDFICADRVTIKRGKLHWDTTELAGENAGTLLYISLDEVAMLAALPYDERQHKIVQLFRARYPSEEVREALLERRREAQAYIKAEGIQLGSLSRFEVARLLNSIPDEK